MKKIDFSKDIKIIINNTTDELNDIITDINNTTSVSEKKKRIIKGIEEFEKVCDDKKNLDKEIETRKYFYKNIFEVSQQLDSIDDSCEIAELIIDNLMKVVKKKHKKENPYYLPIIDTYVLTALYCNSVNEHQKAYDYFCKSVQFGEQFIEDSKKNFHDALNCAYTWVGYYLYNAKKYEAALPFFERVLVLNDEVKDDPNYCLREKDSVPNSLRFIDAIKKELKKR